MENNPHTVRKLQAGGVISILYLLLIGALEAYSAAATTLDRNSAFPSWEPRLGWALFVLPCILIASLVLLHGRHSRCGYALALMNLCLYAGFMIFEWFAYPGQPASKEAAWQVGGFYSGLFSAALLAARFLKNKTQAIHV
ncbi:hypothetical protein HDF16_006411 [Granulicella aggregans]|uniref:Uncharacterized protein n=2 Tax=Granulicella aggregans TaxID=474949 RepID=A0A7W7ZKM0_9BACT|nr:hypothetical protein [Granulicella aggregans]